LVSESTTQLIQLGAARPLGMAALPVVPSPAERARLERQARLLAWGGIAWHVVEFAIAVAAGVVAGSIALIGFGADSLIEAGAGVVVVWLFTGRRVGSHAAERRAQQLIAVTFFVLAAYVAIEAVRTLVSGDHPRVSWVGIGLAAFTAPTMPLLARAKRRIGNRLSSSAAVKEASQTQLCAYLSIALLVGLGANAIAGWWWADPLTALAIAGVALKEGRESWRGEGCADGCC
jgi:divalent metal cation (Fe/Co/Zn/Cd) transporter